MSIVERVVIGDARNAAMQIGAAKIFSANLNGRFFAIIRLQFACEKITYNFACCCAYKRRAAEKNGSSSSHNNRLIGHRRYVGAARRTRAHNNGDLRYAGGAHRRLIVKRATKMLTI